MKPFITLKAIRDYYLYSLEPQESEYRFLYGNHWQEHYNRAMLNKQEGTLTGFIKYFRNVTNNDFFNIHLKHK